MGSYGVGLTFGSERVPERGETVIGTLFRTDDGGKGSNQAVGAARLGAEVSFLTTVGRDDFGDRAFELWAREGVDASAVLRSAEPTMTAAILVEASGDNRIVIVPGALSSLTPEHLDGFADRIAEADVLLVQLEIPVETALHALVRRGDVPRYQVHELNQPSIRLAEALGLERFATIEHWLAETPPSL